MQLSIIAALDRHRAIGKGNALPWQLPNDLKRFKALTIGKPLLMGRRTAESLGRALPRRLNLVLTRNGCVPFEGMHAVSAVAEAERLAQAQGADELCVIGGAEIYALLLPRATRMHLTLVDTVVDEADAFFPDWDDGSWQQVSREAHVADSRHACAFDFVDYVRLSQGDALSGAIPAG